MATQKIADALEGHIRPAPEQWYIFKTIWPVTEAEAAELEARHRAAMANDARGAASRTPPGPAGQPVDTLAGSQQPPREAGAIAQTTARLEGEVLESDPPSAPA